MENKNRIQEHPLTPDECIPYPIGDASLKSRMPPSEVSNGK